MPNIISKKVVFIGENKAGKSSLVNAIFTPEVPFSDCIMPTMGVNFYSLLSELDAKHTLKLTVLDPSGFPQHQSMRAGYLSNADHIVIVIPADGKAYNEQLNAIYDSWLKKVKYSNEARSYSIIICKSDLNEKILLPDTFKDGLEQLLNCRIPHFIVSAKKNIGIDIFKQYFAKLQNDDIASAFNKGSKELQEVKKTIKEYFKKYISAYKLPFFGHHHNERASDILKDILRVETMQDVEAILYNQQEMMEGKENARPIGKLISNPDWHTLKNKPTHFATSGYYKAVKSSLEAVKAKLPAEPVFRNYVSLN
jgi:GTPase SAR1 family protein